MNTLNTRLLYVFMYINLTIVVPENVLAHQENGKRSFAGAL